MLDKIGRELQRRYTYEDIDRYLGTYGISHLENFPVNSKWAYAKEALSRTSESELLEIANDLEISGLPSSFSRRPPKIWEDNRYFRLFLSHLAKDARVALRLKDTLFSYNISCFVAHEDIQPTEEWQMEIERALGSMDAMLTVLTEGFSSSYWTQQEVGFALGMGRKVISLRMDEDPTGFISKHQAIRRRGRTAEVVAEEIFQILSNDPLTRERIDDVDRSRLATLDDDDIPF